MEDPEHKRNQHDYFLAMLRDSIIDLGVYLKQVKTQDFANKMPATLMPNFETLRYDVLKFCSEIEQARHQYKLINDPNYKGKSDEDLLPIGEKN